MTTREISMEPLPSSPQRASSTIPRSLILQKNNASDRPLFPKIDTSRGPSTCSSPLRMSCTRPHELYDLQLPASVPERVTAPRLYDSSVTYLNSTSITAPPPRGTRSKPRPTPGQYSGVRRSNNESLPSSRDEFLILHPTLDITDENGDLSQILLNKWSLDTGEHDFASISLFCEMKLSEVRRMTSWVERPNRFFTTACCQLLDKYVQRLESMHHSPESGASSAFLRKVHDELVGAVFVGGTPTAYSQCVPYFLEYKKLKRHMQLLMANVENREQSAAAKEKQQIKIERVLSARQNQVDKRMRCMLFQAWRTTTKNENITRSLKCKAFRASRKLNLSALFRAWRIEALRRAYQRESVEYQTMLSITAASLSRKDVQIAEADSKMASMAKIIDSLTESNAQLLYRVEQLEAIAAGKGGAALVTLHGNNSASGGLLSFHRSQGAQYQQIDTLTASGEKVGSADDEKLDRANRMLLETMFGMARMVESCAIQMSKDMMDSLEHQLDGSLLQQLAEMIHADNVVKIKAEEARGLVISASPPSTPSGRSQVARKVSSNVAFSNNTMLSSLAKGAVAIKDLAAMPVDSFLLNWFKLNLQMSSVAEKTTDRTIKNFTSDLADGRRFSFLLHRLFPAWFDANMVHEIDLDERLKNVASFHARVQPVLPQVVTSDSIHSGSATENIAFTAMLFGISVQSIRRINLDRQREKFLNIITSWKRVRSLLLEVKRMNENYDSLMIVHLLKEMRTCETLFKQLNSELCSIAIASNESSSTLSHIAYKVLQLTWRCLNAKLVTQNSPGGGSPALELVDERLAERVKDFTHVGISTVRQLLVNDSQYNAQRSHLGGKHNPSTVSPPQAVPEKEVVTRTQAIRDALVVYCKDLHDIFKHYSASGGSGSIASMSMSEFLKLVKDCGLINTEPPITGSKPAHSVPAITQSMIDFIFRAALFFSPTTPREFVVAALGSGSAPTPASPSSPTDSSRPPMTPLTSILPPADPFRPDDTIASIDFGDREMTGYEFVDALLRLASIRCPATTTNVSPLEDRFRDFMDLYVLPNALRSQSEIFRAEVASPKVRSVFQKHKPTLQRIFRYYTSMHALREQQSTMDLKEVLIFAKDCKLTGSFVTEHTLKQVLVNLQRDDEQEHTSLTPDDTGLLRVDFGDFQELLAALTEYVICNPYVPLYKRIEHFLNENVLPRARQKKKGAGE